MTKVRTVSMQHLLPLVLCSGFGPGRWPPAELADDSACVAAGLTDMSSFRSVLDMPNRYNVSTTSKFFAPIYASSNFSSSTSAVLPSVTHAMVLVHGLAANANAYFCDGVVASRPYGASVLNLAPWFGDEVVTSRQWSNNNASSDATSVWWTGSAWIGGENNSPTSNQFTTSFDVLDVRTHGTHLFSLQANFV